MTSTEGLDSVEEFNFKNLLIDDSPLTIKQFDLLVENARKGEFEQLKFAEYLNENLETRSDLEASPGLAMKVAQGLFAMKHYSEALTWLEKAPSNAAHAFLRAMCLKFTGQYDLAVAQFDQAETKGCDPFDVAMAVIDTLRQADKLQEAGERLKRASRLGDIRAEYHYQLGRLHEANGDHQGCVNELEKAVELDRKHSQALFHLAFLLDLYGQEAFALDYYKQCVACGNAKVNALLNLAVVYEALGQNEHAMHCVKRVLSAWPNHTRARLYQKDIESSMTMYYDEDQERKRDRRNKVLEIPISDFELSVRSRNCLKKMNIRYLGDLLKVTEPELLAYKNFGETSLYEIKVILNSKGLTLGQMLEDNKKSVRKHVSLAKPDTAEEGIYAESINTLGLSVRSRKCLERLNIVTLGELCNHTEAELLGCKNFGMTSLDEVREKLQIKEVSLRKLED
ncbi:MAG: hypothetical protein JEZ07_07880 [Phycisphaerae bacterium]|nr:hypothetical protein [Phycisphaerae bacterium]